MILNAEAFKGIREAHGACTCTLCQALDEIEGLKARLEQKVEREDDQTERLLTQLVLGVMAAQILSTMPEEIPSLEAQGAAINAARKLLGFIKGE